VISLLAMSFGDSFCFSRKGGTGRGGWVHLKCENSMAVSGLISFLELEGPPFPTFKASYSRLAFLSRLN